ncbi:MAG: hypothetical protein HOO06_13685 [Bdellovibrionaceae bacterium]|nr:hypothetical protein [Pseudobdellovibrionaceae bacterium]
MSNKNEDLEFNLAKHIAASFPGKGPFFLANTANAKLNSVTSNKSHGSSKQPLSSKPTATTPTASKTPEKISIGAKITSQSHSKPFRPTTPSSKGFSKEARSKDHQHSSVANYEKRVRDKVDQMQGETTTKGKDKQQGLAQKVGYKMPEPKV